MSGSSFREYRYAAVVQLSLWLLQHAPNVQVVVLPCTGRLGAQLCLLLLHYTLQSLHLLLAGLQLLPEGCNAVILGCHSSAYPILQLSHLLLVLLVCLDQLALGCSHLHQQ